MINKIFATTENGELSNSQEEEDFPKHGSEMMVNIHQPELHIAPDMPTKLINKYSYELYGKWEDGLHLLTDVSFSPFEPITMCVLIKDGKVITVFKQM